MSEAKTFYCNWCGKSQHEVAKLIAGPVCFICDECVDLCRDITVTERNTPTEQEIVLVVRWLRRLGSLESDYGKAADTLRKCLPNSHPMHPNQDQDDVPELGDPRA